MTSKQSSPVGFLSCLVLALANLPAAQADPIM
jgi:hypothetical protein